LAGTFWYNKLLVCNLQRLMDRKSFMLGLLLVLLGAASAMSLAYVIFYCCRKRNKGHDGDEESLQGILTDGTSSIKDTASVKSHNGILNLKAPLLKTKSLG